MISNLKNSDAYKNGYEIEAFMVDIYCAYWWGGSGDGCIIDCPMKKSHFVIASGAVVTMDGITTRGAKEHSIWVKPHAYFQAMSCTFEQNGYSSSADSSATTSPGGAAILVDTFAFADLQQCTFRNNKGVTGGAIRNLGEVILSGGDFNYNEGKQGGAIHNAGSITVNQAWFSYNKALADGGAIFTSNALLMVGSTFEHNSANDLGGALYSEGGTAVSRFSLWRFNTASKDGPAIYGDNFSGIKDEGCGNMVTSSARSCDGVQKASSKSCETFNTVCMVPPSTAPAVSPNDGW
ncbi:hypothetical protein ACA910_006180 [Epithemia clementina (nom. ined.)]